MEIFPGIQIIFNDISKMAIEPQAFVTLIGVIKILVKSIFINSDEKKETIFPGSG